MRWSNVLVMVIGCGLSAGCQLLVSFETVPEGTGGGGGATLPTGGAGGAGGTSATGGAGGTGGTGGTGGMPCTAACCSPADCPAPQDPCMAAACSSGQCVEEAVPDGGDASSQVAGDCKRRVCTGGLAHSVPDPADPLDDGDECTLDECNVDKPAVTSAPPGTPCVLGGGAGVCNQGTCMECLVDADCPVAAPKCDLDGHVCVPATCMDGQKNGTETGNDCGGPACAPCTFTGCNENTDCQSGVCQFNFCAPALCSDGVKNGQETGVDCGGNCPDCGPLVDCNKDSDCVGGACTGTGGVCVPACSDKVKNGAETDVDCGGGDCPPCYGGQVCGVVDAYCLSGDCTPEGTCEKGPIGSPCKADGHCLSGFCADGVCCESKCNGACRSCGLAASKGKCTSLPAGTDPANECQDGETCNGNGACAP